MRWDVELRPGKHCNLGDPVKIFTMISECLTLLAFLRSRAKDYAQDTLEVLESYPTKGISLFMNQYLIAVGSNSQIGSE